ncbi:RNA-binding motif protein, X-linked 2 [Ceratocystis fimbriata CBS 114723]|uniref:RNA-binding motif protein, X-linked 2 n=1 Tax=Ceratocystis fimbriata CBS 114723 TaxID=1035309 RepID=A0A2C5XAF7_9PEZI|nr:RNA-binding motif protein, X-linked 2 [Ceratocystis fimbriata CBS 114723]
MNKIRAIQALNQKEIENGISPNASWHVDYRDTAFVYFGGLPLELSEGDIITIFSQFGEPVFIKLARDKETGKSRGFGWLKYEDQRSTDLAVDNLGGATIGGRMISVDHARYKFRDDEDPDEGKIDWETMQRQAGQSAETDLSETGNEDEDGTDTEGRRHRPMLKEEKELALLIQEHDDEDPMKEFLIEEKKKEIEEALALQKSNGGRSDRDKERRHKRYKSSRRDGNDGRSTRDKDRDKDRDRKSKRDREPARDSHRSRRDADGDVDMDSNYKRSEREKRSKRRERSPDTRHTNYNDSYRLDSDKERHRHPSSSNKASRDSRSTRDRGRDRQQDTSHERSSGKKDLNKRHGHDSHSNQDRNRDRSPRRRTDSERDRNSDAIRCRHETRSRSP